jgi:hypothetical protein
VNSTDSIDLINHILQPFRRSLDDALRLMDCSIENKRSQNSVVDDAPAPITNTGNLSMSAATAAGSDKPLESPDRPESKQHPESSVKSALIQAPQLELTANAAGHQPPTYLPKSAAMRSSGAARNKSPSSKPTSEAAHAEVGKIVGLPPANKPNTSEIINAEWGGTGRDHIRIRPQGIPVSRGDYSEKAADGDLSVVEPASVDDISGSGTIEKPKSPDRNESVYPDVRTTNPAEKSTALIPIRVTPNSTLHAKAPTVVPRSIMPPAPRPVRQVAGMLAEGLKPVLDRAYGISQQAFEELPAPVPGEEATPRATRVNNNFHVNVSMAGANSSSAAEHEAIEKALVDILRLAARRHGLEV